MRWGKEDCRCSSCLKKINCYDSPMLRNDIWNLVSDEHFDKWGRWISQIICLPCIEQNLGRKLTEDDLMLSDGCVKRHVPWNKKFVLRHFPSHKYELDSLDSK